MVLVQCGVVGSWFIFLGGGWGLATALLVSTAVGGFEWFGRVAGSVITEAPGVRAWKDATAELAGGRDLMDVPPGVDLVAGTAPVPRYSCTHQARLAGQPASDPRFTFHLKHGVVADLPATATVIDDPTERRRVLATFVEEFNHRRGPDSPWPQAHLDEWVEGSPLAKVTFQD